MAKSNRLTGKQRYAMRRIIKNANSMKFYSNVALNNFKISNDPIDEFSGDWILAVAMKMCSDEINKDVDLIIKLQEDRNANQPQ